MTNLIGSVSLTNNIGVFLGSVNLDNLNLESNQIVYSSDGINMSGLNIGVGLQKVIDNLKTIGNPDIQLTSNSIYVNQNVGTTPIQTAIDAATQNNVIYISSGSYGEQQITFVNKNNIALQASDVGNTITEILEGFFITGNSELIRICNLQIKQSTSGTSKIRGTGQYYFKNCIFSGDVTQENVLEVGKGVSKYIVFDKCEWNNYCDIEISDEFTSQVYFYNCNFGGATIIYNNTSPLSVIMSNCSGLASFPLSSKATLVGINALTSGVSQITVTNASVTTINGSAPVSIASQANTRIPIETSTTNALTSSANLTFNTSTNTLTATNISGTNLTITNINGSSYPPSSGGLSATNQALLRVPFCTTTNNELECSSDFTYNSGIQTLTVPSANITNISGVSTINGLSYPPLFPKKLAYALVNCLTNPATLISSYNIDSVVLAGSTGEWKINITPGTFTNPNYITILTGSAKSGVGINSNLSLFGYADGFHTETVCGIFTMINGVNTDLPLVNIFMMGD